MNTEVIEEEANEWSYFVWKCENSDERMRPRGKPISSGCGEVNIRKSKQMLKRGNDIQDKCRIRKCRRGRRLNGGNTSIFTTKDEAERFVRKVEE